MGKVKKKMATYKRIHEYLLSYTDNCNSSIAILSYNKKVTYQELSNNAYKFSRLLSELELKEGEIVLLIMNPCIEAIELIIACSILGVVFVPISPENPDKRIEYIIEKTFPALIISDKKFNEQDERISGALLLNQGDMYFYQKTYSERYPKKNNKHEIKEKKIAYIIFTSGTTGEPKGVMMSHQAAINFFVNYSSYGISTHDRIGTISPLQFDFSLCDMGITLGNGATLIIVPQLLVHSASKMICYLREHEVTQMNGVPSIWKRILAEETNELKQLTSLNTIMYAGELFPINQLRILSSTLPNLRIVQGFGHSESIGCSYKTLDKGYINNKPHMSIGKSIDGLEMFIVDEHNNEIKKSHIKGQLCIKGVCLFQGYWGNQIETDRVLKADCRENKKYGMVFYSGDIASFDDEGDFYFHGRMDSQIKINGFRIELEGIDNILAQHNDVLQAATVVSSDGGIDKLISFIVARDKNYKEQILEEVLREYCSKIFPRYMLPSIYRFVKKLPSTSNGKINYKIVKKLLSKS